VSVETEIKLLVDDIEKFRRGLCGLAPSLLEARHFEDNFVLDYDDARLRSQGNLLRIRQTDRSSFMTFKGLPKTEGLFKVREELETSLTDGRVALQIFEKLGLQVWFRYQKYREEFGVPTANQAGMIKVAIDETPIGLFSELEGSEEGIRQIATALGYTESQFVRASYYSLYLQFCKRKGERPSHMTFA
jgi:adenylate cyclase, class 2